MPFGPVKFGPAGALFVGLAVGALDPRLGQGLGLIQTLGLALFVYTVGLASGATFFSSLRRQLPLMLGSIVVLGDRGGHRPSRSVERWVCRPALQGGSVRGRR